VKHAIITGITGQDGGLDWKEYVRYHQRYEDLAKVDPLTEDAGNAKRLSGWEPNVRFVQ
jgi:GDP-D-mannose dehydratase